MGNGVCDDVFDGNALVPFTHGMGLIPDELYEVCGSISLFYIIFFLDSYSSVPFQFYVHIGIALDENVCPVVVLFMGRTWDDDT